MAEYNFKNFFKERLIHNNEWVTNGHFLIKKSILTKGQQKMINKHTQDDNKVTQLLSIIDTTKEQFEHTKEQLEFIPESIFKSNYNVVCNSNKDLALREDYYNFLINRGCRIYKGNGSVNPAPILKDDELIGIILPFRITEGLINDLMSYDDYITQLKQEQQAKEELKKLNKKCLYISNNKAVVRNKPLKCVAEITENDKYKNIYIDVETDKNGYVNIYVDLDVVHIYTGRKAKQNKIINDAEYYFDNLSNVTLETYKTYINNALNNNGWINTAEIKLMELAGEPKEYIDKLIQHRENMDKLREKEREEKKKQRQQEEIEFIKEKNKIAYDNIAQAEEGIINNETIDNINITIYNSKYDSNTTSLILYLMKKYNIKVPIKTQGWINNALANIKPDEYSNGYTYQYYTSSSDSTVFYKYLNELVNKIKEEYKKTA